MNMADHNPDTIGQCYAKPAQERFKDYLSSLPPPQKPAMSKIADGVDALGVKIYGETISEQTVSLATDTLRRAQEFLDASQVSVVTGQRDYEGMAKAVGGLATDIVDKKVKLAKKVTDKLGITDGKSPTKNKKNKDVDDVDNKDKQDDSNPDAKNAQGSAGSDGTTVGNSSGGGGPGGSGGKTPSSNDKGKSDSTRNTDDEAAGDPVVLATGEYINQQEYCRIEGAVPFVLDGYYSNHLSQHSPLGRNRISTLDEYLSVDGRNITYHTAKGKRIPFILPEAEEWMHSFYHPHLALHRLDNGDFRIESTELLYDFQSMSRTHYRLVSLMDRNGNKQQFHYNDNGELDRITHSDGYEIIFSYNDQGLRTKVDWLVGEQYKGHLATLRYDNNDNLIRLSSPIASSFQWTYNEQGWLNSWKDSLYTEVQIHYDKKGRVVRTTSNGAYHNDRFEYDDAKRITCYYPGGTEECTAYHFDTYNNVIRKANAQGHACIYEYNEKNQKIAEIDENGYRTCYTYDELGNITTVTLPDGSATLYDYTIQGWLTRISNSAGQNWIYSRDTRGNITTEVDPTGNVTRYSYDSSGNLTAIIDPLGAEQTREYDASNRLIKITDPMANVTQLERDQFGRIVTVTDPKKAQTHYSYEEQPGKPLYQPSRIQFADNTEVIYQYNSEGQITQHINPEGKKTQYHYTAFDLLTQITDPLGNILSLSYDAQQRLTQVNNALNEYWTFERDNVGNLIKESDFANRETHYQYDKSGNLIQKTHPDQSVTECSYNTLNQIIEQHHYRANDKNKAQPETSTYDYNDQGLLIKAKNVHSTVQFERDAAGRITAEIQDGHTLKKIWDTYSGRTSQTLLPSGNSSHYQYETRGLLLAAQFGLHDPLRFQYDARGQETLRHSEAGFQLHQDWDIVGRLQQQYSPINTTKSENPFEDPVPNLNTRNLLQRQYHYNALDNPVTIHDQRWGSTHYQYNANQQITSADHNGHHEHYDYDAAQNIRYSHTPKDNTGEVTENSINQWQQQAGGSVQHIKAGNTNKRYHDKRYQYDSKGRLIQKTLERKGFRPQTTRYQWDNDDRLIKLITPENKHYEYQYDALGRRIQKQCINAKIKRSPEPQVHETSKNTGKKDKTLTNNLRYIWDGNTLAEEVPLYADGSPAWDEATSWYYEPESFRPIAKQYKQKLWYIVTDAIGTPKELIHEDGEHIGWAQQHTIWGQTHKCLRQYSRQRAANDPNNNSELHPLPDNDNYYTDCNLRYQGQYFDEESGLHYNNQRYYDPETAQYLSPDPIGLLGGTRPQGYVDNPSQWIDPLGLEKGQAEIQIHEVQNQRLPHVSVKVTHNGKTVHTDQRIVDNNKNTTMVDTQKEGGLSQPTKTVVVDLPNAKKAQIYQNSNIGKDTGIYNSKNNSCLTQACDVLRAGGIDAPKTTKEGIRFLQRKE